MATMANQKRGDSTYEDFGRRTQMRTHRSVEPKNGGPNRYTFAKVVGRLSR